MQISRHWRMNAQRYRLTGVRTVVAAPAQSVAQASAVQPPQPSTRAVAAR